MTELPQDAETKVTLEDNSSKWFVFKTTQDGYYGIHAHAPYTVTTDFYCMRDNKSSDIYIFNSSRMLETGTTIYMKLTDSNSYTQAQEVLINTLYGEEQFLIEGTNSVSIAPNSAPRFMFKALKDGYYEFSKNVSGTTLNVYETKTSTESLATSMFLKAGQKVYVEIDNESTNTNYEFSIYVTHTELTEIPNSGENAGKLEVINAPASKVNWYVYTAPQAGFYEYLVNSNTNIYYNYIYTRPNMSDTYTNESNLIELEAGEKIYIRVYSSSTENSISSEIKRVDVTLLPVTGEQTLEASSYRWYKFAASNNGYYRVSIYNLSGQIYTVKDNKSSNTYDMDYSFKAQSGDVKYVKVRNVSAEKKAFNISVLYNKDYEVLAVNSCNTTRVASDEPKYAVFTAPESAYYQFESNSSNVKAEIYKTPDSSQTLDFGLELATNETVYVKYTNMTVYDKTVDVSISKLSSPNTLPENGVVSGNIDDEVYYSYTAQVDGIYTYQQEGDATVAMLISPDYDDSYARSVIPLNEGQKAYFYVKFNSAADTTITVSNAASVTEMTLDTAAAITQSGEYARFKAPKTGYYVFSIASPDSSTSYNVKYSVNKENNKKELRASNDKTYYLLEAGESVIFEYYSSAVNVTVSEIEKIELNTSKELLASGCKYAEFIAPATDEYVFSSSVDVTNAENSMSYSIKYGEYSSLYVNNTNIKVTLKEGSRVIFWLYDYSNISTATVTVSETYKLPVGETYELTSDTKYVDFVAPVSGQYEFTTSATLTDAEASGSYRVRHVYNNSTYYLTEETVSKKLMLGAGEKISFQLSSFEANVEKVDFTVTKIMEIPVMTVGDTYIADLGAGEAAYYQFTAAEEGEYSFYSTPVESSEYHDSYANLYDRLLNANGTYSTGTYIAYNDDGNRANTGYGDFRITYALEKGQTVYLKVKSYSSSKEITCNVHVEKTN